MGIAAVHADGCDTIAIAIAWCDAGVFSLSGVS
jgi:hypothetical protein